MNAVEILQHARHLLDLHGLHDWTIQPINTLGVHGYCAWDSKKIALSIPYLTQAPLCKIEDTILHEIAHALTPYQGHNHIWKAKCIEIGCIPNRLNDFHTARYLLSCICGAIYKSKKLSSTKTYICRKCYARFRKEHFKKIL